MPPVVAAVIAVAQSAFIAFASFVGSKALAAAIINVVLTAAVSAAASALFAPKLKDVSRRQAETLAMQLGEGPRVAIFGEAATGGTLADAFNHGSDNEWETIVVMLADHKCHAMTGFIIDDTKYAFASNGQQASFDEGSKASLYLYWYPGTASQTASTYLTTNSGGRWVSNDKLTGVSYVVASYRYSEKVWKNGRPRFRFIVQGKECYDPRLDDTVDGGSGAHRWDDETTRAYSTNAKVCEYNWRRGVYSNGQLMVGPGRSAEEAPPADEFAAMNLCDEDVPLKAGGTEKRYTVSAVILANERWIDTQQEFARSMAGDLIDRAGVTQPDPGAAKTAAFTFTDANLIEGGRVEFREYLTRDETVNTVTTRYVEPTKLYQPHSAPLRRDQDDIDTDGEPREAAIELGFVISNTQAQRVAEIARRKARMQRQATVTLGPEFMGYETGDWINWQSDLYLEGDTFTFEVRRTQHNEDGTVELGLREIAASCFTWDEDTDQLDDTSQGYVPTTAPSAATLSGWAVTATSVTNAGAVTPAIKAEWTVSEDGSVGAVLIEWRKQGTTAPVFSKVAKYSIGEVLLADGLVSAATFEVRGTPITAPQRAETATAYTAVTIAASVAGDVSTAFGHNSIVDGEFRQPTAAAYWAWNATTGTPVFSVATANALRYAQNAVTGHTSGQPLNIQAGSGNYNTFHCNTGDRIEASAYVGGANLASVTVYVRWYDSAGAFISDTAASSALTSIPAGAGALSAYTRVGGFATAPTNARRAALFVGAVSNATTPTLRVCKPFIAQASTGATTLTPWNLGFEGAPGADVTLSNTAAAITGQGSLATLSGVDAAHLTAGVGNNSIVDGEFRQPSTYWVAGTQSGAPVYTVATANVLRYAQLAVTGHTSGHYLYMQGDSANIAAFHCNTGDRVEASAYLAGANLADITVYVRWFDSAGSIVSDSSVGVISSGIPAGAGALSAYTRVGGFATAPTNARRATILVLAHSNATTPTLRMCKPMIAQAASGSTALTPWNIGYEGAVGADVTLSNTAAAITGQAAAATDSTIEASATKNRIVRQINTAAGPVDSTASGSSWTDVCVTPSLTAIPTGGTYDIDCSFTWQASTNVDVDGSPGFQGQARMNWRVIMRDASGGGNVQVMASGSKQAATSAAGTLSTAAAFIAASDLIVTNTAPAGDRELVLQEQLGTDGTVARCTLVSLSAFYYK